jgi:ABC-type sugar transport system ATPase subunit
MTENILELKNITKRFSSVEVLQGFFFAATG